ncbi:glycosyl transferase [Arcobacter sp. CECT 8986]|uniref:glycosyltransferase n=1 Tax=Arcobacter sp. CECT 8986 TaxID=2044507 RepID=UPI001009E03E|nr:glycosyltransferase [Arcobacter sp. CECT 8986]RXK00111.1 glycosyl transferase [Arcobacter sp. CECT 8986]
MKTAVIMSAYKNDKLEYLKECLESLYNQTFKEFDILVQCDGVLPTELESYLDKEFENQRIKYLNKRDENKGLAFSLNELVEVGLDLGYEYFIRMDADDICVTDRIKKQIELMERNQDIDICGGLIEEFNMDSGEKQIVKYPEKSDEILKGMQKRNSVAHVTTCMRKSFFEKVGLYDSSKMNEDFDLWIRGFEKGCKFYNIQEVLVKVRTNNAFFKRRKNIKRAKEVMQLKLKATRLFGFGVIGYIYAIGHFILFMLPGEVKKIIYKFMRK